MHRCGVHNILLFSKTAALSSSWSQFYVPHYISYSSRFRLNGSASHIESRSRTSVATKLFFTMTPLYSKSSSLVTTCWKCETKVTIPQTNFPGWCPKCRRLQKYSAEQIPDYFTLLGQSALDYTVDLEMLSSNMKKLQRQLHPDLFSNKETEEQELSQSLSSLVNEASVTLHNPIERGLYLLHLRGISIDLEKEQTLDSLFLAQVMELNEELEELSTGHRWEEFRSRNNRELQVLEINLAKVFEKNDLQEAQQILFKMKYYENLQLKLKEVQGKFNIVD